MKFDGTYVTMTEDESVAQRDELNAALKKVDALQEALVNIGEAVSLEDGESWDDPYSLLESIDMQVADLYEEGLL